MNHVPHASTTPAWILYPQIAGSLTSRECIFSGPLRSQSIVMVFRRRANVRR